MLEVQYLNPVYNKQNSFNRKAIIIYSYGECTTTIKLYSYETHVATIQIEDDENRKTTLYITHNEYYLTNTTIKHIKEFCLQYGFNFTNVKDMLKHHEDIF